MILSRGLKNALDLLMSACLGARMLQTKSAGGDLTGKLLIILTSCNTPLFLHLFNSISNEIFYQ